LLEGRTGDGDDERLSENPIELLIAVHLDSFVTGFHQSVPVFQRQFDLPVSSKKR
jgi:hypothetical protein